MWTRATEEGRRGLGKRGLGLVVDYGPAWCWVHGRSGMRVGCYWLCVLVSWGRWDDEMMWCAGEADGGGSSQACVSRVYCVV